MDSILFFKPGTIFFDPIKNRVLTTLFQPLKSPNFMMCYDLTNWTIAPVWRYEFKRSKLISLDEAKFITNIFRKEGVRGIHLKYYRWPEEKSDRYFEYFKNDYIEFTKSIFSKLQLKVWEHIPNILRDAHIKKWIDLPFNIMPDLPLFTCNIYWEKIKLFYNRKRYHSFISKLEEKIKKIYYNLYIHLLNNFEFLGSRRTQFFSKEMFFKFTEYNDKLYLKFYKLNNKDFYYLDISNIRFDTIPEDMERRVENQDVLSTIKKYKDKYNRKENTNG